MLWQRLRPLVVSHVFPGLPQTDTTLAFGSGKIQVSEANITPVAHSKDEIDRLTHQEQECKSKLERVDQSLQDSQRRTKKVKTELQQLEEQSSIWNREKKAARCTYDKEASFLKAKIEDEERRLQDKELEVSQSMGWNSGLETFKTRFEEEKQKFEVSSSPSLLYHAAPDSGVCPHNQNTTFWRNSKMKEKNHKTHETEPSLYLSY